MRTQALVRLADREVLALGWFPAGPPDAGCAVVEVGEADGERLRQAGRKRIEADGTIVVEPAAPDPLPVDRDARLREAIASAKQALVAARQGVVAASTVAQLKAGQQAAIDAQGALLDALVGVLGG
jgi:ABC-type branched-subunit amino acid transport system substrate-binding protein